MWPSEVQVSMSSAAHLPNDIKEAKSDQDSPSNSRKPVANPRTQSDPQPSDAEAKKRGEGCVTGGSDGGDGKSFQPAPTLQAGGENKRQPMGWDRRMKKSDAESGDGNSGENRVVHYFFQKLFRYLFRLIFLHTGESRGSGRGGGRKAGEN